MDFATLHSRFKNEDSPSVEGQIRWLQKQGFAQHQIEQAMLATYSELDQNRLPVRWEQIAPNGEGKMVTTHLYSFADHDPPTKQKWDKRPIQNGFELDQVLLEAAKKVRTDELSSVVKNMELFEKGLQEKWKKANAVPWYKKLFGKKAEK